MNSPRRLSSLGGVLSVVAFLVAGMTMPSSASAQVIIDDFEDGNLSEYSLFPESAPPTLSTTDMAAGGSFAAQLAVDADENTFAGFFRELPDAPFDLSSLDNAYLEFDAYATQPLTLEINFQDADGQSGEIRNALIFDSGTEYQSYALPLLSFFNSRPEASFNPSDARNIVFTLINLGGADSDTDTDETVFRIDNIRLSEGLAINDDLVFDDFDSGDISGYFKFDGRDPGSGPETNLSTITDTPDGSANALRVEVDADEYAGFAGFGKTISGAPVDVSTYNALNFRIRSNSTGNLEINLQSDAASGGNQSRETIMLMDTGDDYLDVSVPLAAFIQTDATPANPATLFNVVFTAVGIATADGDTGTNEFVLDIDNITFGSASFSTSVGEVPAAFDAAPSAFPNPTAGAATVAFALAEAGDVRVDVFDVLGRRVAALADGPMAAGPVRLDVSTEAFAPGTYVVRIATEAGVASTRLTVAR